MKNSKRYQESNASHFTKQLSAKLNTLFLTAPTDGGVIRNKGRSGARYAPEALLSVFKKMSCHLSSDIKFAQTSVISQNLENIDFDQSQQLAAKNIFKSLSSLKNSELKNILHIGGGHDHVYSFLKAIEMNEQIKNIVILNIDAHCDTRIDDIRHSGTPFRNFCDESKKDIFLIQYGIHSFANSKSTLSPLKNIKEQHISYFDIHKNSDGFKFFSDIKFQDLPTDCTEETFFLLSLDADAIDASVMEGVSAVNHQGLPLSYIQQIVDRIKLLKCPKAFGIYEYNPVYDNLSQKGARSLCSLIYNWIC